MPELVGHLQSAGLSLPRSPWVMRANAPWCLGGAALFSLPLCSWGFEKYVLLATCRQMGGQCAHLWARHHPPKCTKWAYTWVLYWGSVFTGTYFYWYLYFNHYERLYSIVAMKISPQYSYEHLCLDCGQYLFILCGTSLPKLRTFCTCLFFKGIWLAAKFFKMHCGCENSLYSRFKNASRESAYNNIILLFFCSHFIASGIRQCM